MLEIRCFNGFEVLVDGQPLTRFYSQKSRGLLTYLAVTAGRAHARSHLAGMLWPEYTETRARRNLSQTLTALRKDLGEVADRLDGTGRSLQLKPASDDFIDVHIFRAALTSARRHDHLDPLICPECTEQLQTAADLYRGPFLDQFNVSDSTLFENWVVGERERYLQQATTLLTRLSNSYAAQNNGEAALQMGQRLLELAPWQESAHRQRMLLLAQQGLRIQALAQYDTLCDVLMAELGVSPDAETDALYDQILAGEIEVIADQAMFTPSPSIPTLPPPYYAPTVSPHFVGRERELAEIEQLAANGASGTKRVALVGMGGIGKSAFAAYVAKQLRSHFTDGVLWGNSKTSDANNILDGWARAYGHDFSAIDDLESKSIAVRGMLFNKQTLVVIDNVDDAAAARPLLPDGEQCLVILTTRNLDVAVALNATPILLVELQPEMSQQLFLRMLGKARVMASAEEEAAATKIGELLHHLPLAIEIAGKRLLSRPRMRLAALAHRLENTQQRLGLEISDQAVRASFQVSWEGLTKLSQQLFATTGIFEGRPFEAEALAAVANLPLFDAEDELYSLVALSLVSEDGETRYRQHPLLADFAAERLAENSDSLATHQHRLATYYQTLLQDAGEDYGRLTAEWDHINAVVDMSSKTEKWQQLLQFADTLTPALKATGRYSQARHAYSLAHQAAQQIGDEAQEALVLVRWGEATLEQSDHEEAKGHLTRGLELYQQLIDQNGIAHSKNQLARIAIAQSQLDDAQTLLNESEAIYRRLENDNGLGNTFFQQGFLALRQNRLDQAKALLQQAQASYELSNNQTGRIESLRMLAHVALELQEDDEAGKLALEAKELSEEYQAEALYASSLYLLTGIYRLQGKLNEAFEAGEECLSISRRTGRQRTEGLILSQLSLVQQLRGDLQSASQLIHQSLAIFKALDHKSSTVVAMRQVGDIHQQENRPSEARSAWQAALQLARQINYDALITSLEQRLAS